MNTMRSPSSMASLMRARRRFSASLMRPMLSMFRSMSAMPSLRELQDVGLARVQDREGGDGEGLAACRPELGADALEGVHGHPLLLGSGADVLRVGGVCREDDHLGLPSRDGFGGLIGSDQDLAGGDDGSQAALSVHVQPSSFFAGSAVSLSVSSPFSSANSGPTVPSKDMVGASTTAGTVLTGGGLVLTSWASFLTSMARRTAPVPRLTGCPTMMFSATPFRGSTSPTMPAVSRWSTVISKAARARIEDFCPATPWRPMALTSPSAVMTSATSMRWRRSTWRPWPFRVPEASSMMALRAASMPSSSWIWLMSLVMTREWSMPWISRISFRFEPSVNRM